MLSEKELELRLKESENRYRFLQKAKQRKDSGIKCPSLSNHELKIMQVACGGNICEEVKSITGFDWEQYGYQIGICLVCETWVILKYTGELIAEISENQAKKLARMDQ